MRVLYCDCGTVTVVGLYKAFDENMDGHIDFKEMVCGLSACCKGPEAERQKCMSMYIVIVMSRCL